MFKKMLQINVMSNPKSNNSNGAILFKIFSVKNNNETKAQPI